MLGLGILGPKSESSFLARLQQAQTNYKSAAANSETRTAPFFRSLSPLRNATNTTSMSSSPSHSPSNSPGSSNKKHNNSSSPGRNNTKVDNDYYKLKNARDRMRGSMEALLDYFAHHAPVGAIHPTALQDIRETLLLGDDSFSSPTTGLVGLGSSTSSSDSTTTTSQQSSSSPLHFSCAYVTALEMLHQYVECLATSNADNDNDNDETEIRTLLVLAAWEAMGRYLQQVQRRLQQLCFCPDQNNKYTNNSSSSSSTRYMNNKSNNHNNLQQRRRQELTQLNESIVTCLRHHILLLRQQEQQQQRQQQPPLEKQ